MDENEPLEDGIPSECEPVISRLLQGGHLTERPDQLTVNKYEPGQGEREPVSSIVGIIVYWPQSTRYS